MRHGMPLKTKADNIPDGSDSPPCRFRISHGCPAKTPGHPSVSVPYRYRASRMPSGTASRQEPSLRIYRPPQPTCHSPAWRHSKKPNIIVPAKILRPLPADACILPAPIQRKNRPAAHTSFRMMHWTAKSDMKKFPGNQNSGSNMRRTAMMIRPKKPFFAFFRDISSDTEKVCSMSSLISLRQGVPIRMAPHSKWCTRLR